MNNNSYEELSLPAILAIVRKNILVIAAVTILLPSFYLFKRPKPVTTYSSETVIRIGRGGAKPLETLGEIGILVRSLGTLKPLLTDLYKRPVSDNEASHAAGRIKILSEGRLLRLIVESGDAHFAETVGKELAEKIIERHKVFYKRSEVTLNFFKGKTQLLRYTAGPYDLSEFSNEATILEIPTVVISKTSGAGGSLAIPLGFFGLLLGIVAAFIIEFIKSQFAQKRV